MRCTSFSKARPPDARSYSAALRLYDWDIDAESEELVDYALVVRALTPIERHDLVWVERINAAIQTGFESLSLANQDIVALLSANAQIAEQLRAFAAEFWAGTEAPHERRGTRVSLPLWQYLTERVEVLGCEKLA